MNYKKLTAFLIFLLVLASCNNPKKEEKQEPQPDAQAADCANKLLMLQKVFETPDSTLGKPVPYKAIIPCKGQFESDMADHGIDLNPGRPLKLDISSIKLTQSVEFQGQGLLDWMLKAIATLDPNRDGSGIRFRLVSGTYTEKFLNDHMANNESERTKRKNRITIFIVPVAASPALKLLDDGMAYEFGGIQP
jgi:hypothetical protein